MNCQVDEDWDWGNVSNLGMFTYALCERKGKNKEVEQNIRHNIITVANKIVNNAKQDLYRRPLKRYYWGCNGTVARQTINLFGAECLNANSAFKETALGCGCTLFDGTTISFLCNGIGIKPTSIRMTDAPQPITM